MIQSEAFVAGLLAGAIIGMSDAIARIVTAAAVVVMAITVAQAVNAGDASVHDATQHVLGQLFGAARQYWTVVVGFAAGMFVGALARRGR